MASIIGVETLQHTNGTTAATIDSSGRFKRSVIPAFRVAKKTTSGVNGADGHISFNHEFFDHGNNFNTNYFEAPIAGLYSFSFIGFGSTGSGTVISGGNSVSVRLDKSTDSGTTWVDQAASYAYTSTDTYHPNMSFSSVLDLEAGDRVRIECTSQSLYHDTNTHWLQFSGHLIG